MTVGVLIVRADQGGTSLSVASIHTAAELTQWPWETLNTLLFLLFFRGVKSNNQETNIEIFHQISPEVTHCKSTRLLPGRVLGQGLTNQPLSSKKELSVQPILAPGEEIDHLIHKLT